jgi:glutathione S-transferase
VPTFLDGDIKLHESNAILRYLCSKHALSDWYPSAPRSWFERMLAIEGFRRSLPEKSTGAR